jgi:hypothetical protein
MRLDTSAVIPASVRAFDPAADLSVIASRLSCGAQPARDPHVLLGLEVQEGEILEL